MPISASATAPPTRKYRFRLIHSISLQLDGMLQFYVHAEVECSRRFFVPDVPGRGRFLLIEQRTLAYLVDNREHQLLVGASASGAEANCPEGDSDIGNLIGVRGLL